MTSEQPQRADGSSGFDAGRRRLLRLGIYLAPTVMSFGLPAQGWAQAAPSPCATNCATTSCKTNCATNCFNQCRN